MNAVARVSIAALLAGVSIAAGPKTRQQAFQIYDAGGFAPGADVTLVWDGGALSGVSEHQGRIVFDVPTSAGTATVAASRGGFCSVPKTVDVSVQHTWGHFIPVELVPCG